MGIFRLQDGVAERMIEGTFDYMRMNTDQSTIHTGLDLFDRRGGLHRKEVTVIAGNRRVREDMVVNNLIYRVAVKRKCSTLYFTLGNCLERLVRGLVDVGTYEAVVECGLEMNEDKIRKSREAMAKKFVGSNLIIDDTGHLTIGDIEERCRRYKEQYGLDLIVLDDPENIFLGKFAKDSEKRKSEICRKIADLAIELNCHILIHASVALDVIWHASKKPTEEDIGFHRNLREYADNILLVFDEDAYKGEKDKSKNPQKTIFVTRNAHGTKGTIHVPVVKEFLNFETAVSDAEMEK